MQPKYDPKQGLPKPSPYLAEPAAITIGDVVVWRSYPMKVWSILSLSVALHADQKPGTFLVLKGNNMHPHIYAIVPIGDVERPQTFSA